MAYTTKNEELAETYNDMAIILERLADSKFFKGEIQETLRKSSRLMYDLHVGFKFGPGCVSSNDRVIEALTDRINLETQP